MILRALDAKHTSKIILEELGVSHFVMVREERIKGTKWILTALDMRVIAREHVKVGIGVLDQHAHVFKWECGEAHLLSDLLRWLSRHGRQFGLCAFKCVDGVVENILGTRDYPRRPKLNRCASKLSVSLEHAAQHHGANKTLHAAWCSTE